MIQRNYTFKIANSKTIRSRFSNEDSMLNFIVNAIYHAYQVMEGNLITIAISICYNVAACVIKMSHLSSWILR